MLAAIEATRKAKRAQTVAFIEFAFESDANRILSDPYYDVCNIQVLLERTIMTIHPITREPREPDWNTFITMAIADRNLISHYNALIDIGMKNIPKMPDDVLARIVG